LVASTVGQRQATKWLSRQQDRHGDIEGSATVMLDLHDNNLVTTTVRKTWR